MRRALWSATLGLALAGSILAPSEAAAQREEADDVLRGPFGLRNFTIEIYGGLATYGRFLEQYELVTPFLTGQRELTGDNAFMAGGSFGITILPMTVIRFAYTRASTELEFENDDGFTFVEFGIEDLGALDIDDVADLTSNTFSVEFVRYLRPERARFNAYGLLGLAGVWWNLDDDDTDLIVAGDDETMYRFAGVGGVGLQYRFSRRWAARLEATTFSINNPFDGDDSYFVATGLTFDEPDRVNQANFRLAVAYTFGHPERPGASRRRRR